MKSTSILITNYNSFEAIQLCIESVRKYTKYPHKILVMNDKSPGYTVPPEMPRERVDEIYLRDCRDRGWIELHENDTGKQLTHGGSLNVLMEKCDTDYAAILDCDIQILAAGWLTELVTLAQANPEVIVISDYKHEGITDKGYRTGFYMLWFGLIDMNKYRDGMQVDWKFSYESRSEKPYDQIFNNLSGIPKPPGFDDDLVLNDPGSQFWVQVNTIERNPKAYKALYVPMGIKSKYRHYGHISMISVPNDSHSKQVGENRRARYAQIKKELAKLRKFS